MPLLSDTAELLDCPAAGVKEKTAPVDRYIEVEIEDPPFSASGRLDDLDRLLSLMIHQIRNYCMSIKGYASLLEYEDGMSEKGKKWIFNISRGINGLESFLGEFDNYRLSKKRKVEVLDYVFHTKSAWRSLIERIESDRILVDLDIEVEGQPLIRGDKHDFRKMILHLLKNSLEALDGEGKIRVSFTGKQQAVESGRSWSIEVQDNGKGMTAQELEKAGEILHSTKSSHIGCGLNFVSAVSSQMGAKVEISSKHEVGTVIKIIRHCSKSTFQTGVIAK